MEPTARGYIYKRNYSFTSIPITTFQPASEQEESTIPVTHSPHWTAIRSLSEPTTPISESSEISDHLSEISELEFSSTQSDNSLPTHSYTSPTSTAPNIFQSVLPDSTTNLPLSELPISIPKMSQYVIPPLVQMPIRGSKNAPHVFKGNYKHVELFIGHYEQLLNYYHVTSESDKCHGILQYCSWSVKDFIQINPHYLSPNWTELRKDILNAYDAERMSTRIRPKDFFSFIHQCSRGQIANLSQWKKYHREYIAKAGFLKQQKQINDLQYHGYFWYGIPEHLRGVFDIRLQAKDPSYDGSEPWPITSVQEVAESYFKRSKFTSQLPHLPSLGYDDEEEDEDSDSDYDNDSDSDDSDEWNSRRKTSKAKKKKKKKAKGKPKREFPITRLMEEEPSRNIIPPPEEKQVEGLIHRLNTMSLDDPQYGPLYYQAVKRDASGLVAQCIMRKPKQYNEMRPNKAQPPPPQTRELPPHPYSANLGQQQKNSGGVWPRQPGMSFPATSKCFGCSETSHSLRDCPKMAQLLRQGKVILDHQTFKYRTPDGQPLYRRQDECLAETVARMQPPPTSNTVNFATIQDSVRDFHSKASGRSYLQYSLSDTEDDGEEYDNAYESDYSDDEEEFEEGHWKRRLKQHKNFPTYTAALECYDEEDEVPYEVFPAERNDKGKTTRQARDAAMNNPIKKSQLDGVYMPPRNANRVYGKLPDPVSNPTKPVTPVPDFPNPRESLKEKENIPPSVREPIPVDARKPRFKDTTDIIMEGSRQPKQPPSQEKTITLQDYNNRPSRQTEGKNTENSEYNRTGPRQSDLSMQTDSKDVVKQILETEVSLPIGKILGVSKNLTDKLQDYMRYKNPVAKPGPPVSSQKVYSTRKDEQETEQEELPKAKPQRRDKSEFPLIKLKVFCHGRQITAIIDTGSQVNLSSKEVAEKKICLPIDITEGITIGDVNGHSKFVAGKISNAVLQCGDVVTLATDIFIAPDLPCDLLLGRPWQTQNLVGIDERRTGTYLLFRDPETDKIRYEICIEPEHKVPVESYKRLKVYTALQSIGDEPDSEMESESVQESVLSDNVSDLEEPGSDTISTVSEDINPASELSIQEKQFTLKWLIGYGPFKSPGESFQYKNFDYHIYLHLLKEPIQDEELWMIYGNPPYSKFKTIALDFKITEEYIKFIDKASFQLLEFIIRFYTQNKECQWPHSKLIPVQQLKYPQVKISCYDPRAIFNIYETYQFPRLERIIGLATNILHDQSGTIVDFIQKYHPQRALELMASLEPQNLLNQSVTTCSSKLRGILAYGPYPTASIDQLEPHADFQYRIYLHFPSKSDMDNKLQIAYGNPPFYKMERFNILFQDDLFHYFNDKKLGLLMQTLKLIIIAQEYYLGETLVVPKEFLHYKCYPTPDEDIWTTNPYKVYRLPEVEEIIQIATILVDQPQGLLMTSFRQKYPDQAAEVFTNYGILKSAEELTVEELYMPNPKIDLEEEFSSLADPEPTADQKVLLSNQRPYRPIRHFIGYGPYLEKFEKEDCANFKYRIYLHLPGSSIRVGDLHIVYGDYPYHMKELIHCHPEFSNDYFNNIDQQRLHLLIQILKLLIIGEEYYLGEVIDLPPSYLDYTTAITIINKKSSGFYEMCRFPAVEEIIKLATVLVHQPDGKLMSNFLQTYPGEASRIFTSHRNLISRKEMPRELLYNLKLNIDLEAKAQIVSGLCLNNGENNLQKGQTDALDQNTEMCNNYQAEMSVENTKESDSEGITEEMQENNDGTLSNPYFSNPKRSKSSKSNGESDRLFKISETPSTTIESIDPEKANQLNTCPYNCKIHPIQSCKRIETKPKDLIEVTNQVKKKKDESESPEKEPKVRIPQDPPLGCKNLLEKARSGWGKYISKLGDLQTIFPPLSPIMSSSPEPQIFCTHKEYQLYTALAKTHGEAIFDMLGHIEQPEPLALEASRVIVATNSLVPHDAILPFSCAEIIAPATFLKFSHNGTDYKLHGDSYVQFTYFTGDPEAQFFHSAFNARPTADQLDADDLSVVTDAINSVADGTNTRHRSADGNEADSEDSEIDTYIESRSTSSRPSKSPSSSPVDRPSDARSLSGRIGIVNHPRIIRLRLPEQAASDENNEIHSNSQNLASDLPIASVFLASVAGPLCPTPIHLFQPSTPSKLRMSTTNEE